MTARGTNGHAQGATVLAERYRLEEQVAAGGMGEVWRATDMLLERTVAVKLLRESLAEDPVLAERFRREALTTARLSHPNMADVYDYVQENGRPGIVMEFVEGETLAERIARDGALDAADAVRIVSGMLGALQQAHEAGVVHRDVKPGNVMLSPSRGVKVTDFGIARAAGHETLTETGMVVGTAHYLSPEQVSGKAATPSSDLYAVGAILYEALTGVRPFEADTPLAVAMRRLTDEPASPAQVRSGIPEPVAQVVMRALAREPSDRFRSAAEMLSALETAFASGTAATAPRRTDPTPTMKLPTVDDPSAPTVALRPEPVTPITGSSPSAAVAERRRRDYRRGIVWLVAVALIVGAATMGILALGGGGPITVPDFTGMQIGDARTRADDVGLLVVEVHGQSARPAGEVIDQDIPARKRVAEGETVTLTVSTGTPPPPPCCEVPNLEGLTEDQAKERLESAGLELGSVREETSDAEPGTVIHQDPSPGETADGGDEVDIVVAKSRKGKGKGNND